jgi:hypothetical protein
LGLSASLLTSTFNLVGEKVMQKNDNTPREERTSDNLTKGYKKTVKQAEKLTRKLVRLLEYDEKNLGTLLLFIDLFERNSNRGQLIDLIASSARGIAFSPITEPRSHKYIRGLIRGYT